jgi:hypothetical protein
MSTNKEIIAKLSNRRLGLQNALADQEIMTRLAVYEYDQAALQSGLDLVEAADASSQAQGTEYGEQHQATQNLEAGFKAANAVYVDALLIARRALRDDPAATTALQLGGRRKSTISGWLNQATAFYKGLLDNAAWQAKLRGYDAARLQSELDLVEQVQELDRAQEKEKGEAREATNARDQAVDQCDDWWEDFVPYASVALKDLPDKLKLVTQGEI